MNNVTKENSSDDDNDNDEENLPVQFHPIIKPRKKKPKDLENETM